MERPEFFVSSDGVMMAVITFAEYDRLRKNSVASERARMPAGVVARLELGANKVRVWREYRGMSSAELARRTELTNACIAQIEGGYRTGSVATLKKLAVALSVAIDDLV